MTKSNIGKLISGLGLFGGGALIGAAVQDTIRTNAERKQREKDAAEDRLQTIEERLRCAEKDIERRDELIKQLTKELKDAKTK